jgi:CRP-like cAMP-binding protein
MYQGLKQFLEHTGPFDDQDWAVLVPFLHFQEIRKGSFLLRQGEIAKSAYYLIEGCLRIVSYVDSREVIRNIFLENSFFTESDSFFSGTPSLFHIDTVEDSRLFVFYKKDTEKVFERSPNFRHIVQKITEQAVATMARRNSELMALDGTQRYLKLLEEKPHLIQRVPQHMIASYLGLTPEALSRIRKSLTKK